MSLSSRVKRAAKQIAFALTIPAERLIRLFPSFATNMYLAGPNGKLSQLILQQQYKAIRQGLAAPMSFREIEFRAYSQNSEDGILLYIFGLIGFESRRCVEICAGDGIECNTANLIINHGWNGLLFDGDPLRIKRGRAFYRSCRDTFAWPPKLVQAWVTAENVNELIESHGFAGEIDLLSIDVDGMDYWIWRAIDVVRPRVVVIECCLHWGPERSVTVPYDPRFRAQYGPYGADYAGASVAAMVKLARAKGYRLIGCEKYGVNAFFLRSDLAQELLPEVSPAECLLHPYAQFAMQYRHPKVAAKEWVEV